MSIVTVAVATVTANLPTGVSTNGDLSYSLLDSTGAVVQTQTVAGSTAVFTGVADGSYTVSVAALDTTGAVIGTPITASVTVDSTVTPPVTTFQAPSSLTVTVSPDAVISTAPAA